jgi:hypothetical protein
MAWMKGSFMRFFGSSPTTLRFTQVTVDDIYHYAKICRVSKVFLPYMESRDF